MIEILIFELTAEQQALADEGYPYSLEESQTRWHTFLAISSFGEYIDPSGGHYTSIYSEGVEFVGFITYKEFQSLIIKEFSKRHEGRKTDG